MSSSLGNTMIACALDANVRPYNICTARGASGFGDLQSTQMRLRQSLRTSKQVASMRASLESRFKELF
jgi:hypothetical protein